MKVELLESRVTAKEAQNRGDVIEVEDAVAVRMIEAGQAKAVRSATPEKAVKRSKAEKASK